jgi:hypothetical protein
VPLLSVGALNPNESRALFSDDGPWVTAWATGAMVVSTFPTDVNGSLMPPAGVPGASGAAREALDPDDFRGGFAAWSGTSFAAPALAAWVLRALLDGAEDDPALGLNAPDPTAAAGRALRALRQRGWRER